ncbi:hypothetical protein MTR67_001702 [Solanum verrucosum]|uniref:Uncharacterized protein n=1 Tax=Solanum verrucosum TaxID=315347 RepID=A0AAF0T588_SOLVR|nr:hypothetical protein MTR67_001702 [Solanum verrucosum]
MSSQVLLFIFMFGNTAKTTFKAIIFLFVMHPFDVGHCVEIDRVHVYSDQNKSDHWYPDTSVMMRDIEDLNMIRWSVWITHTMNLKDMREMGQERVPSNWSLCA